METYSPQRDQNFPPSKTRDSATQCAVEDSSPLSLNTRSSRLVAGRALQEWITRAEPRVFPSQASLLLWQHQPAHLAEEQRSSVSAPGRLCSGLFESPASASQQRMCFLPCPDARALRAERIASSTLPKANLSGAAAPSEGGEGFWRKAREKQVRPSTAGGASDASLSSVSAPAASGAENESQTLRPLEESFQGDASSRRPLNSSGSVSLAERLLRTQMQLLLREQRRLHQARAKKAEPPQLVAETSSTAKGRTTATSAPGPAIPCNTEQTSSVCSAKKKGDARSSKLLRRERGLRRRGGRESATQRQEWQAPALKASQSLAGVFEAAASLSRHWQSVQFAATKSKAAALVAASSRAAAAASRPSVTVVVLPQVSPSAPAKELRKASAKRSLVSKKPPRRRAAQTDTAPDWCCNPPPLVASRVFSRGMGGALFAKKESSTPSAAQPSLPPRLLHATRLSAAAAAAAEAAARAASLVKAPGGRQPVEKENGDLEVKVQICRRGVSSHGRALVLRASTQAVAQTARFAACPMEARLPPAERTALLQTSRGFCRKAPLCAHGELSCVAQGRVSKRVNNRRISALRRRSESSSLPSLVAASSDAVCLSSSAAVLETCRGLQSSFLGVKPGAFAMRPKKATQHALRPRSLDAAQEPNFAGRSPQETERDFFSGAEVCRLASPSSESLASGEAEGSEGEWESDVSVAASLESVESIYGPPPLFCGV